MHRADPTRVWYLMQGGSALGGTLMWVLAPVYFVQTVGMSPLQLVLVGTFMELSVFVFELPTGIVVGGCVFAAVGVVVAALMPEAGFKRAERGQTESALRVVVRTGLAGAGLVRRTPVLVLILAIAASWGAWSEGYDRLAQAHLLRD